MVSFTLVEIVTTRSEEQDRSITSQDDETTMNYDFALKEVILTELNSGELSLNKNPSHFTTSYF